MLSQNDERLIRMLKVGDDGAGFAPTAGHIDRHDDTHHDADVSGTHSDYMIYTSTPPEHYDYTERRHEDSHNDSHDDFEEGVAELEEPDPTAPARQPEIAAAQLSVVLARLEGILGVREQQLHREVGLRLDEFVHEVAARLDAIEDRLARLDRVAVAGHEG